MKRVLLLLLGLVLIAAPGFASPPSGSFDFALSPDNPDQLETLSMDRIFAFDWWYTPDPFYDNMNIQGVPDNFRVRNAAGGFRTFGDIYAYYPSTEWHTALLEFPADLIISSTNDIEFLLNVESSASFEYLPGPPRELDNTFFIRNLRTFDSYASAQGDGGNEEQPIPEPATLSMLGTGILGLLGLRIGRRRAR